MTFFQVGSHLAKGAGNSSPALQIVRIGLNVRGSRLHMQHAFRCFFVVYRHMLQYLLHNIKNSFIVQVVQTANHNCKLRLGFKMDLGSAHAWVSTLVQWGFRSKYSPCKHWKGSKRSWQSTLQVSYSFPNASKQKLLVSPRNLMESWRKLETVQIGDPSSLPPLASGLSEEWQRHVQTLLRMQEHLVLFWFWQLWGKWLELSSLY